MNKLSKKLQVRIDPALYEALRKQAELLGYNSLPAYIRAWAVAEVQQPSKNKTVELTRASTLALRYIELLLGAQVPQAENTDTALSYVRGRLAARSWTQKMQELGLRER